MGINIITRGIVTLFLIGVIFLGLMPTVHDLATNDQLWENVTDSRAVFLRDNAMTVYYISGIFSLFTTIVWMLNASQSRGASTVYG